MYITHFMRLIVWVSLLVHLHDDLVLQLDLFDHCHPPKRIGGMICDFCIIPILELNP